MSTFNFELKPGETLVKVFSQPGERERLAQLIGVDSNTPLWVMVEKFMEETGMCKEGTCDGNQAARMLKPGQYSSIFTDEGGSLNYNTGGDEFTTLYSSQQAPTVTPPASDRVALLVQSPPTSEGSPADLLMPLDLLQRPEEPAGTVVAASGIPTPLVSPISRPEGRTRAVASPAPPPPPAKPSAPDRPDTTGIPTPLIPPASAPGGGTRTAPTLFRSISPVSPTRSTAPAGDIFNYHETEEIIDPSKTKEVRRDDGTKITYYHNSRNEIVKKVVTSPYGVIEEYYDKDNDGNPDDLFKRIIRHPDGSIEMYFDYGNDNKWEPTSKITRDPNDNITESISNNGRWEPRIKRTPSGYDNTGTA